MKNPPISRTPRLGNDNRPDGFPGEAELAALRGWYAGLSSRDSVGCYLESKMVSGVSTRGMIGNIRRKLISIARQRHRPDLVALLDHPENERAWHAKTVAHVIKTLRVATQPVPKITDDVSLWLSVRAANALYVQGIKTRGGWRCVSPGVGAGGRWSLGWEHKGHAKSKPSLRSTRN